MPSFEAKGEIIQIFDTNKISDKFRKREFVLKIDEQYSQEIMYQLTQDDCAIIDSFKVGDMVKVNSWVRGRKWQKTPQDAPRWFNTLQAYKIEGVSAAPAEFVEENKAVANAAVFTAGTPTKMGESDTLPF